MSDVDRDTIIAAGAVVWRERGGRIEIALVHRPKYDDWSLPKGKLDPGEVPPVAAVREVDEETGLRIRLGASLPAVRYKSSAGPKIVWYWVARVDSSAPREPDSEVDELAWVHVSEVKDRLTYEHDRSTVASGMVLREATNLIVVRHASAVERQDWSSDDRDRPLGPEGHAEAVRLRRVLEPWALDRIVTSPALRCLDSLKPYAGGRSMAIGAAEELTEEVAEHDPARVMAYIRRLLANSVNTVVCTHRPLLAPMADALGIPLRADERDEPLPPAGMWVIHLRTDLLPELLVPLSDAMIDVERYTI